jgi:hypothetical protein
LGSSWLGNDASILEEMGLDRGRLYRVIAFNKLLAAKKRRKGLEIRKGVFRVHR